VGRHKQTKYQTNQTGEFMPNFGTIAKYLGLFSLGKGVVDKVVLQKMLTGGAAIIGATVIVAILAGALIIAAFGGIYYALVTLFPLTEWAALLIVCSFAFALMAFLVYKIVDGVKRIASASSLLMQSSNPISTVTPVVDVFTAFINGLTQGKPEEKKSAYPRPVRK